MKKGMEVNNNDLILFYLNTFEKIICFANFYALIFFSNKIYFFKKRIRDDKNEEIFQNSFKVLMQESNSKKRCILSMHWNLDWVFKIVITMKLMAWAQTNSSLILRKPCLTNTLLPIKQMVSQFMIHLVFLTSLLIFTYD
jgi:hypothetical protein